MVADRLPRAGQVRQRTRKVHAKPIRQCFRTSGIGIALPDHGLLESFTLALEATRCTARAGRIVRGVEQEERLKNMNDESAMARHKADVSDGDFEIYASYHGTGDGRYMGSLRVIRKSDRKILFPFDGAPQIGPFATPAEAREAAVEHGRKIVAADRAVPEE